MKFIQCVKAIAFLILAIAILIVAIRCGGSNRKETRTASRTEISSARGNTTSAVVSKRAERAVISQKASAGNGGMAVNAAGKARVSVGKKPAPVRVHPEEAPAPRERPPTDNSAPAIPERQPYSVQAPKQSSLVIGSKDVSGRYEWVSGTMDPGTSTITINLLVTSRAIKGFATLVVAGDFAFIPGSGAAIELGEPFTYNVPSGQSVDVGLEFVIPRGTTHGKLRVRDSVGSKYFVFEKLTPPESKP